VPHGTDEAEDRHSNFYDAWVNLDRGDRRCHVALLDLRDEARRHACELGELLARQVSTAAGLPLPSSLPVRDYGVSAARDPTRATGLRA